MDLSVIARGTPGFSGADLANLVNEAALNAARFNKKKVEMIDFEYAKDKVMMGPERKSMIMTEEEKRNTAYHEGGHALVAAILPDADPLHKVTIIPRGRALGVTMQLPAEDKYSHTKEYLEATITVMMGGRIAEEKFLGHMTTGAGNDIEKATDLARKMVCEWGMSELGPLTFGKVGGRRSSSAATSAARRTTRRRTANQIDAEVKRIVTAAYERAKKIIDGQREGDAPPRPHAAREGSPGRRRGPADHRRGDRHRHREAAQDRPAEAADRPPPGAPGGRGRERRAAGSRAGAEDVAAAESAAKAVRSRPSSPSSTPRWRPRGACSSAFPRTASTGSRTPKSRSLGELATHVTELPRWGMRVRGTEFRGRQREGAGDEASAPEFLARFDENVARAGAAIAAHDRRRSGPRSSRS